MEYKSTQNFTGLKVWQKCRELVLMTYALTKNQKSFKVLIRSAGVKSKS